MDCNFVSTWNRRQVIRIFAAMSVGSGATQADAKDDRDSLVTDKTDQAIRKGLRFLVSQQNENGSFGSSANSRDLGVCGLAGMALLSQGSTPQRGPYRQALSRCIRHILASCGPNGFISNEELNRPMYGHGFCTMLLAEVFGSSREPELRNKLAKAVQLIVDTQNNEGGWRYEPAVKDADLSVTVCEIMALRAAKDAGIFVPTETISAATKFVIKCQNEDGGFMYQATGGASAFGRSAAGIVALNSAGIYDSQEVKSGLKYLRRFHPAKKNREANQYFFYGHYYAALAMWQLGGTEWESWYRAIRDDLLSRQSEKNGAWETQVWCNEYATAMALIILQIPNGLVPLFHR